MEKINKFSYKIILILILIIICLIILFRYKFCNTYEKNYNGTLYINGEEITNENVTIHYRKDHSSYAELPFVKVLECLGYNLEWNCKNTCNILYNNIDYTLNICENTLFKEDDNINLILPLPGNYQIHKALDKELILTDHTIKYALLHMDKSIDIEFDFEKSIVYITDKNRY